MAGIEIKMGKSARRAYGLRDISLVPSRRTRDPEDVDISWQIDAFRFELPLLASALDSVVGPATAIEIGRLGGLGVLNLEGLWTRYEDPSPSSGRSPRCPTTRWRAACRRSTPSRSRPSWWPPPRRGAGRRGDTAGAVTPQRATRLIDVIRRAEVDLLVIQGTIVSAEHVARQVEPLNLKTFIRQLELPVIVGGCATYQAALHLMRTGAAGVLVGVGSGRRSTMPDVLGVGVPLATAVADVRAARMRHLDETGVYCQVIADGGMTTGGDIARAVGAAPMPSCRSARRRQRSARAVAGTGARPPTTRACGAPPRRAPGHPSTRSSPARLRHRRAAQPVRRLRRSMAFCGYETLKDFQKAEVVAR